MMVHRTFPLAALLGLPLRPRKSKTVARKKFKGAVRPTTRRREPRPVAAPVRKKFAACTEHRSMDRKSKPTFAELLDVELPAPPKAQRQPAPAIADVPAPKPEPPHRDGLSSTARRIIALGMEARGEILAADGIEAELRHMRDETCGITAKAREIIDREVRRQASKPIHSDPSRRAA